MKIYRIVEIAGNVLVLCSYALLFASVYVSSPLSPTKVCNVSDATWSTSDLVSLMDFCSDVNPWPRPVLNDNITSVEVYRRSPDNKPKLAKLHRSYRLANKAWSNHYNGPKRTKFTSEEVVLLDGFDATPATVSKYAAANNGTLVVAYLSVGSFEEWRSDAAKWPSRCIGKEYDGWAGENWIDLEHWVLLKPVMLARLKMVRDKGFVGYEGDNIGLLDQYDNAPTSARNHAIAYARWLADTAHSLGLLAILKNAPYLAKELADVYDAVIVESALQYNEVQQYAPFYLTGKPVWIFEYSGSINSIEEKLRRTNVAHKISDVLLDSSKGWKRVL